MHKFGVYVFCVLSVGHLAAGQFSLGGGGGGGDSSGSAFPRIKLAGPLGSLIGGQGISLNSGLGQVLSSLINTAANGGGSSSGGGPFSQLATAASSNYINAIRALPFGQFGGGGGQQQQAQPQQPQHSQFGGHSGHNPFGGQGMQNPLNFLTADSSLYGGQPNFEHHGHGGHGGNHFAPNSFPHFPAENYFGNQFGGYGGNHGGSSSPMSSSALYGNGDSYRGHAPSGHHLDK